MRRFLLSLGLFMLLCAPASAGTLFPPTGAVANASGVLACAADTTLVWSANDNGRLECVSTSQMVTIPNCSAGTMLIGISNGAATCIPVPKPTLTCFNVASTGSFNGTGPNAVCPAGSVIVSAGCQPGTNGDVTAVGASSSNNSAYCSGDSPTGTVEIYALCCRLD